jgi:hypothetical protein
MLLGALQRYELPASSGTFSAQAIPHSRVSLQLNPISSSNEPLGRQDTCRWTPGDPFRPDKFDNRIVIFITHLYFPFAANSR